MSQGIDVAVCSTKATKGCSCKAQVVVGSVPALYLRDEITHERFKRDD
jgi:hypothetical protein